MPVTLQDIVKGLDPTGFNSISGAELAQMVDVCSPADDRGMTLWTEDSGATPDVPNPEASSGYNKLKRYLWIRQMATTTKVYAWNDTAASDATYLKWIDLTNLSIATGSVTNTMLAGGITNDKIVSLEYSKISGAPTSLAPTGAAGGDLSGTYPNPTIGAAKILPTHIAASTGAKLVQVASAQTGSLINVDTSTYFIPADDSIPQKTEGYAILTTGTFTPQALTNYLHFKLVLNFSADLTGSAALRFAVAAVFVNQTDGGAQDNAVGAAALKLTTWAGAAQTEVQDAPYQLIVEGTMLVSDIIAALEEITFQANVGLSSTLASSNIFVNGFNDEARKFGGVSLTTLIVEEYRP